MLEVKARLNENSQVLTLSTNGMWFGPVINVMRQLNASPFLKREGCSGGQGEGTSTVEVIESAAAS